MADESSGSEKAGLGGGAIASLTGVGVLLLFIVQNTDDVRLKFLVFSFTWPIWLFTIVTALFGALIWFGIATRILLVITATAYGLGLAWLLTNDEGGRTARARS